MKARVKATGEIVDVEVWIKHIACYLSIILYRCGEFFYEEKSLDFENLTEGLVDVKEKSLPKDEPDYWEKLKHQYAGMAMQGLLSNSAYLENYVKYSVVGESFTTVVTENAVDYATILVNKLKEDKS